MSSIITLTTDFGESSPYVAAMKGVILSINPEAQLVDLSHQIPPQNLQATASFLCESLPLFPPEAIHLVVVDPGVGTDCARLYVELGSLRLVLPDNGIWTWLAQQTKAIPVVYQLTESRFWRNPVSSTFHGRDIFAPVAAHLSRGLEPDHLGPKIHQWQDLPYPEPSQHGAEIVGVVLTIDHFGNLITNIPAAMLQGRKVEEIRLGSHSIRRIESTYGEASEGELLGLISSSGRLEIAVTNGSAQNSTGAIVGDSVKVMLQE